MSKNNQEEVYWGRKVDEAGKHEESRGVAVVVPRKTGASYAVAEPAAAGKHPMTRVEALLQILLSVPYSAEAQVAVGVMTLRENDTAAFCPFSRFL